MNLLNRVAALLGSGRSTTPLDPFFEKTWSETQRAVASQIRQLTATRKSFPNTVEIFVENGTYADHIASREQDVNDALHDVIDRIRASLGYPEDRVLVAHIIIADELQMEVGRGEVLAEASCTANPYTVHDRYQPYVRRTTASGPDVSTALASPQPALVVPPTGGLIELSFYDAKGRVVTAADANDVFGRASAEGGADIAMDPGPFSPDNPLFAVDAQAIQFPVDSDGWPQIYNASARAIRMIVGDAACTIGPSDATRMPRRGRLVWDAPGGDGTAFSLQFERRVDLVAVISDGERTREIALRAPVATIAIGDVEEALVIDLGDLDDGWIRLEVHEDVDAVERNVTMDTENAVLEVEGLSVRFEVPA